MPRKSRKEKYTHSLERALHYLAYDGRVRVVQNKDRTIDAELIIPVPRGVNPKDILDELEDSFTMPRDSWLTLGVRLEPGGVERVTGSRFGDYNQFRGMVDISIYPGRVSRKGDIFERAREDIVQGLVDKRHNKPKEVVLRLFYSPKNEKPVRKGE